MDKSTANKLIELNKQFYDLVAQSFDATRQQAWSGWYEIPALLSRIQQPLSILDIGCGNGRFFQFLQDSGVKWEQATGFDQAESLLEFAKNRNLPRTEFRQADLFEPFEVSQYNVVTAFGVWHHIPGQKQRLQLLEQLVFKVKRPGIVIVSLWHMPGKKSVDSNYEMEEGDVIIGWQNNPDAKRYCHAFSETEIEELMTIKTTTMGRFEADGKDGRSNTYLYFFQSD